MGRTRRRSAALVLSLLQQVRHSYRPHAAVETRAPEGQWFDEPFVTGAHGGAGSHCVWFGSDLFYANFDRFAG